MKRVTGLGGIMFKSADPAKVRDWYQKHLGIPMESWGAQFKWRHIDNPEKEGYTVWSAFKNDTTYLNPSQNSFMVNYIVEDLVELLKVLKEEGVQQIGDMTDDEYGKFAWILDPEGNKIELWEPPA